MSRLQARFEVSYPGFRLDVDLDVPAQGVTAVFGPSGCGKTTLLRCLAGLERSPVGFFEVDGKVWQDESRRLFVPVHRRPIGYVFQEPRLFPHLSVRSNLVYGYKRTPDPERRIHLDRVVQVLDVEHLLERRPGGLSGGEQQRVAIGRALLASPRLLLMDEPLSSLDLDLKRDILPFVRNLETEFGIPIVYVSHAVGEILQIADRVVVLGKGRVVATGSLSEVFARFDLHGALNGAGQDVGTILETTVAAQEPDFGLTRLDFQGRALHVPHRRAEVGERLRIHVLPRDVTVLLGPPGVQTSALNLLEATVLEIHEPQAGHHAVEVQLDVGSPLRARITRKSLVALGLQPGHQVYVHFKATALADDLAAG